MLTRGKRHAASSDPQCHEAEGGLLGNRATSLLESFG